MLDAKIRKVKNPFWLRIVSKMWVKIIHLVTHRWWHRIRKSKNKALFYRTFGFCFSSFPFEYFCVLYSSSQWIRHSYIIFFYISVYMISKPIIWTENQRLVSLVTKLVRLMAQWNKIIERKGKGRAGHAMPWRKNKVSTFLK